jgi:ATP-binding cassette subfamily F protein 3
MPVVIRFENIHKAYGGRVLLEQASAALTGENRWALIGRNGCGKSTLLRILLGEEEADGGEVWVHPDLRLGYLEQHDPFRPEEPVIDFLQRYGGQADWRCAEVAARLGLGNDLLDQAVTALSGGYRTRAKLAGMLLREPDFLVLDEPTNFLDLRTQILLERFLADWQGGALIVSHDRSFLGAICDRTLAVEQADLLVHSGPVASWLAQREERREQIRRSNLTVEAKRRHLQQFVDSNRANANTASQARNKQKQLDRLQTIAVDRDQATVRLRLPPVEARSGCCLRTRELAIGYPDHQVASGIDLEVDHGSRVAVVGDNGQGKTTLVRSLCDDLPPRAGSLRWSHGCELGVYAQHVYASISTADTIEGYLTRKAADGLLRQDILDVAGSFLFSGDDVRKQVAVLSGGERARLCLAGLLLSRPSVMLLDEPTNHLDVETVEALVEALRDYRGTLFVVSHERDFLAAVATNVIEVRDGVVRHYPGNWEEYRYRVEQEIGGEASASAEGPTRRISDGRRLHQLRKQCDAAERKVSRLEQRLGELEGALATSDPSRAHRVAEEIAALRRQLAAAEGEWFSAQEALEAG